MIYMSDIEDKVAELQKDQEANNKDYEDNLEDEIKISKESIRAVREHLANRPKCECGGILHSGVCFVCDGGLKYCLKCDKNICERCSK